MIKVMNFLLVFCLSICLGDAYTAHPATWMYDNIDTIGQYSLREICIPGSHNSGMSICQDRTIFAPDTAIKTQTHSVADQLFLGVRYFDIRPCLMDDVFYTGHYSKLPVLGWQGANGESIDDIVKSFNHFTEGRGELIMVNLSHALHVDSEKFTDMIPEEWELLFEQLQRVRDLFCVERDDKDFDITSLKLSEFIGKKRSAVVFFVSDAVIDFSQYWGKGIYSPKNVPIFDKYSETNDHPIMVTDQLEKMFRYSDKSYFLLSWTLTQDTCDGIMSMMNSLLCKRKDQHSVLNLAGEANAVLEESLLPVCDAKRAPNVILVDDVTPGLRLLSLIFKINDKRLGAHF